jgi:hypothetical protein
MGKHKTFSNTPPKKKKTVKVRVFLQIKKLLQRAKIISGNNNRINLRLKSKRLKKTTNQNKKI